MSKREEALRRINLSGVGLELGPLFSPIVTKQEADISYIDHLSTEDLRNKYHGYGIPLDQIVPVDYVLKETLKTTLGKKKFDYVIASHVIEHIPDTVRWLQDVASILNDNGILSLVIPDKRFTFDILRNESRPADVIGAYLDKLKKPSSVMVYDFTTSVRRKISAAVVWANPNADYSKYPKNTFKYINEMCQRNLDTKQYVDTHCFVFTPYSFFEIIRSLIRHDLFDFEVAYFCDTPKNELEFYVSLRKVNKTKGSKLRTLPKIAKPPEKRELAAELQKVKNDYQKVVTSKSWQITKPLRLTSKFLKRMIST